MRPLDEVVVGMDYSFQSCHGRYLSADSFGSVTWSATEINTDERFEIITLAGGWCSIRTAHGKYLSAGGPEGVVGDRGVANTAERFIIGRVRPGVFSIKTHRGLYLSAQAQGPTECRCSKLRECECIWIWQCGNAYLGTVRLYHETSPRCAFLIVQGQLMRCGTAANLMFGKAIYFADTPELARHKSRLHGAMLVADVDLNWTLFLDRADSALCLARMNQLGYQSVKGRGAPGRPWEYAVYNPAQVKNIRRA